MAFSITEVEEYFSFDNSSLVSVTNVYENDKRYTNEESDSSYGDDDDFEKLLNTKSSQWYYGGKEYNGGCPRLKIFVDTKTVTFEVEEWDSAASDWVEAQNAILKLTVNGLKKEEAQNISIELVEIEKEMKRDEELNINRTYPEDLSLKLEDQGEGVESMDYSGQVISVHKKIGIEGSLDVKSWKWNKEKTLCTIQVELVTNYVYLTIKTVDWAGSDVKHTIRKGVMSSEEYKTTTFKLAKDSKTGKANIHVVYSCSYGKKSTTMGDPSSGYVDNVLCFRAVSFQFADYSEGKKKNVYISFQLDVSSKVMVKYHNQYNYKASDGAIASTLYEDMYFTSDYNTIDGFQLVRKQYDLSLLQ